MTNSFQCPMKHLSLTAGLAPAHMTASQMFYDKGDIKCLEFVFYNPSKDVVTFDQCQIIGISVDYGLTIEGKGAEHFMSIPAGSITVNDLEIGVLWLLRLPLAFSLTRHTDIPIVVIYLICEMTERTKVIIGFILVKRGIWIHQIVSKTKEQHLTETGGTD